jgi:ABC-type Co2+ transport system permease subunit
MVGEHLLVFGWIEAIVTALAVAYLARTEPDLLAPAAAPAVKERPA